MLVFEEKGNAGLPQKNLRGVDFGLEPRPHQSRTQSSGCLVSGATPTGQKARRLWVQDCGHIGGLHELSTLRHP